MKQVATGAEAALPQHLHRHSLSKPFVTIAMTPECTFQEGTEDDVPMHAVLERQTLIGTEKSQHYS